MKNEQPEVKTMKRSYMALLRDAVMSTLHQNTELTIDGFVTSPKGDFRWLSNFEPCSIEFEGIVYPSTEHAYHAMKTMNPEERKMIAEAPTPSASKTVGQKVTMRPDWDAVKTDCMRKVLEKKFVKGSVLGNRLEATFPADLIESNWWHDNFWGTCLCPKCNDKGLNTLGKLLMERRDALYRMTASPEVF
jgi:ribA/ribD-fused uncharacterized protein